MPYDHAYSGACDVFTQWGPANGSFDPGADAEVNTLAHETEETTTDELGTAWFDSRGFENADKCAWTFGTTHVANGGTYERHARREELPHSAKLGEREWRRLFDALAVIETRNHQ